MRIFTFLIILSLVSCSQNDNSTTTDDEVNVDELYFPPVGSSAWATRTISEEGWNEAAANELLNFLELKNTEAFIILKNGKIIIESYMNGATAVNNQPWNSAGKTLTAFTVGIAENEGLLSIEDATSQYLGDGWTNMTTGQEGEITLLNQLTMTSGADYTVPNSACYDPECLLYLDDPGNFWYYHNAFYTLLHPVLDVAVDSDYKTYFNEKLKSKIGMNGAWLSFGFFNIYYSTARSMARFGILNLNNGAWEEEQLIAPSFFTNMTNTSQDLNKAYGYLWWLNGKESYQLPLSTETFPGKLIPNAPDDLIAGLGRNDQKLYIVPSMDLVIVRMGGTAGTELAGPSSFDNELWEKINAMIN